MKAFKSALTNIRRTPYQATVAILVISITFFIGYTLSLFLMGTEEILKFFETRPQVIAFFEIDSTISDINAVKDNIKDKAFVKELTIVSKDEALKIYRDDNKKNPLLLELVTADILPASIEVSADSVEDLVAIKETLEKFEIIEEVVLQQDTIDALNRWTSTVRLLGLSLTAILGITSFLIMMVIIGFKVANKKTAITVMSIIGANKGYILGPFIWEAIIYFFFGSLTGFGLMFALYLYSLPFLQDFLVGIIQLPLDWQLFAWLIAGGSIISFVLGFISSILAVNKVNHK
jgi:cell division transport system permease protein